MWHELIEQFSQLDLPFETDRLLAIGAIAEQVQAVRKGEDYLAGLWSGSLLENLLSEIARDKRASPMGGWALGSIKMLLRERVPIPISPPPRDVIELDAGLPENRQMFRFPFHLFEIGKDNSEFSATSTSYFLILRDTGEENGSYSRIGIARLKNSAVMNKLGKSIVITIK